MAAQFETQISNKEQPFRLGCKRYHGSSKELDLKNVATYICLRKNGCPKKEAILFAQKNNCRIDATKLEDGPKNYRILKCEKAPSFLVEEGWIYGSPDFNLGTGFASRYANMVAENMNDERMEDNFNANEIKLRNQYKEMIARMKNYLYDINKKYDFNSIQGQELIKTIRRIVIGMKGELENRSFLVINNIRFYDIADLIIRNNIQKHHLRGERTIIEMLNCFDNFEDNPDFSKRQIFKVDQQINGESNDLEFEMDNDGIYSQGIDYMKKKLHANNLNPIPFEDSIPFANGLKHLEQATNLLEDFQKSEQEDQSIGKQIGRFDRALHAAQLVRQEEMKQNLMKVRFEAKVNQGGLESQFNQQKYFFVNKQSHKIDLQKEQKEKDELMKFIQKIYNKPVKSKSLGRLEQINMQEIKKMKSKQDEFFFSQKKRIYKSVWNPNTSSNNQTTLNDSNQIKKQRQSCSLICQNPPIEIVRNLKLNQENNIRNYIKGKSVPNSPEQKTLKLNFSAASTHSTIGGISSASSLAELRNQKVTGKFDLISQKEINLSKRSSLGSIQDEQSTFTQQKQIPLINEKSRIFVEKHRSMMKSIFKENNFVSTMQPLPKQKNC